MKKLRKALGDDSFISAILKLAEELGFRSKYLQLYLDLLDGGCTSHQDQEPKLLLKWGGDLNFTMGADNCSEPKDSLHKINLWNKIVLIKGLGTGALTGISPDTGKKTGVYHKNSWGKDTSNITLVFYDNAKGTSKDKVALFASAIAKLVAKFTNGEQLARVNDALETWADSATKNRNLLRCGRP